MKRPRPRHYNLKRHRGSTQRSYTQHCYLHSAKSTPLHSTHCGTHPPTSQPCANGRELDTPSGWCSQAIAGGHTTRDLGQFSKTNTGLHDGGTTADGVTRPFTEEVVSYKHGDNVILHQWAGGGDLLVNCQSPTPQSFICQVRAYSTS